MKSVGNGRRTPILFSILYFEYERENGNGTVGNENENELIVFRKRTNSSGVISNTAGERKFKYEIPIHGAQL